MDKAGSQKSVMDKISSQKRQSINDEETKLKKRFTERVNLISSRFQINALNWYDLSCGRIFYVPIGALYHELFRIAGFSNSNDMLFRKLLLSSFLLLSSAKRS